VARDGVLKGLRIDHPMLRVPQRHLDPLHAAAPPARIVMAKFLDPVDRCLTLACRR
jgi:hypothetical protein